MARSELDLVIDWAAQEGWNPGLYDADAFYNVDPNGFFIGLVDDKPVACISAVAYDKSFGFMGFYITKPEYRGKGYGTQLWAKAMKYLKTQNIGLDGVIAQQENYKRSGFKLAYGNVRYEGKSKRIEKSDENIINLQEIAFDELLEYDNKFFPTTRPKFLKDWINLPESSAFGILQNNKLAGYGVIRKCRQGYKIGPLFTDNGTLAENLFIKLNNTTEPESLIYLDVPEVNSAAVQLAKKHNMKVCFETVRMYSKQQPHLPLNKIFGVTTFELG